MASAETFEAAAEHRPLGRKGRPGEIADAVSGLVSPEASFVTGSDITPSRAASERPAAAVT